MNNVATRGQNHQLAVGVESELGERSALFVTSHGADFKTNCFKHTLSQNNTTYRRKGKDFLGDY